MKEVSNIYNKSRTKLIKHLLSQERNNYCNEKVFNQVQKIMDRIVFIFLAEEIGLFKPGIIKTVMDSDSSWEELKQIFFYLDDSKKWPFFPDDSLYYLEIKNEALEFIGTFDSYRTTNKFDVDLLGKIFEDSSISGYQRKQEGVYFTPVYLIDFIMDHTVGEFLNDQKNNNFAEKIRILDPACGAGVFLCRALDYLAFKRGNRDKKELLKNNIYGVDINEELANLARLSLFLKSLSQGEEEDFDYHTLKELTKNIKCGNSIVDCQEIAGDKAFSWEDNFPGKGFDVIIGNPPWGGDVGEYSSYLSKAYPDSTKFYKDPYKIFIDKSLSLLNPGGYLGFVVPNSFIYQPGYKDVQEILSFHEHKVINLGHGIFENVCMPAAILILKKSAYNGKKLDRSLSGGIKSGSISDLSDKDRDELPEILSNLKSKISTSKDQLQNNFNISVEEGSKILTFGEVFELRDAGIQYAKVGAGKENKGKSDLPKRLFNNKKTELYPTPVYKGSNINREGWQIIHEVDTYLRKNPEEVLKEDEWVRYGKDIFERTDKIVWRQTSDRLRAAIMDFESYFGKSVQGAVPKDRYMDKLKLNYALAVFNSSSVNSLYQAKVMEKGRVFPQVKLYYLRSIPFIIPSLKEQWKISELVAKLIGLYGEITENSDKILNNIREDIKEVNLEIDKRICNIYNQGLKW